MIYYSNFCTVIITNEKVDQFYFYFSILSYTFTLTIFIYLSYYLPYFKNIHENQWENYVLGVIDGIQNESDKLEGFDENTIGDVDIQEIEDSEIEYQRMNPPVKNNVKNRVNKNRLTKVNKE